MPRRSRNKGINGLIEGRVGTILVTALILMLLVCSLFILTPLFARAGYTSIPKTGASVTDPDGTDLTIPEGAVARSGLIKITNTPRESFVAGPLAQSLPTSLEVKSPLYKFAVQGERPKEAKLSLPIPLDAQPYETLDLYALLGTQWFKIPFTINQDDERLESSLNFVPDAVIVAQTKAVAPVVGVSIQTKTAPPSPAAQLLGEVNPSGLRLSDDGSIAGRVVNLPETSPSSTYEILPTVTNRDSNGVRLDLTENMLNDDAQRAAHVNALVDLAVQDLYLGYDISYEGLGTGDQDAYTAFIKELARQLHAKQKLLSVTLPVPKPIAQDEWDTQGYNWALIGRYADKVKIQPLPDAHAYEGDTPLMDQYLQWAVGQVDRYKLQLLFSTIGRDESADQFTPVAFGDALKLFGKITIPDSARPGDPITLDLPQLRESGGIQVHDASGRFYFNYKDDQGAQHKVWLENAASLAKNVEFMLKYNLHGLTLQNLDNKNDVDARMWTVLDHYRTLQVTTLENNLTVVWIVDGKQVGKSPANNPQLNIKAPDTPGNHKVELALSVDGGVSTGPSVGGIALNVATPKPTAVPPTPRPTAAPPEDTPTPRPTKAAPPPVAQATEAPKPPPAPAGGGNFNGRNLFGYGAQLNWTNSDRDSEMGALNGMGFGWAKIQVRWCDVNSAPGVADLGSLDNITQIASAHGIRLLFSVVCAPSWSRADGGAGGSGPPDNPQDLANFLGGIAGKYCGRGLGAIEVWNEENLLTEWHGKAISAQAYVDMLRASYGTIKAACPDIVVVSGAPTPTGVMTDTAVDDQAYLRQMYAAGLKTACDAVGAHPSGFNNPPDADWRSWADPQRPNFKGHPSFFYRGTMEGYRTIMVQNGDGAKQVWPTEFGWGVTASPFPGYEYEAQMSETDQANWLVQSYQMAKAWGWVGAMFLWNLDFTNMGNETGAFHVLGRPAQGALSTMPK